MKVVKKSEVNSIKNSPRCFVEEYPAGDKDINAALIRIKEKYPDSGFTVNEVCKELVHVMEGPITLTVGDEEVRLEKDDEVIIDSGEKFRWDGTGTILTVCTPAFYPKQHKEVE